MLYYKCLKLFEHYQTSDFMYFIAVHALSTPLNSIAIPSEAKHAGVLLKALKSYDITPPPILTPHLLLSATSATVVNLSASPRLATLIRLALGWISGPSAVIVHGHIARHCIETLNSGGFRNGTMPCTAVTDRRFEHLGQFFFPQLPFT